MKVLVKPERCKECGLCDAFCPKKAISHADHTNLAGYHPVVIDDEKCIGCVFAIPHVPMAYSMYWENK